MSATNKEEFIANAGRFLKDETTTKPILFEVFVTTENEIKGDKNKPPKDGLKRKVQELIGSQAYNAIREFIKPDKRGGMSIDKSGSN